MTLLAINEFAHMAWMYNYIPNLPLHSMNNLYIQHFSIFKFNFISNVPNMFMAVSISRNVGTPTWYRSHVIKRQPSSVRAETSRESHIISVTQQYIVPEAATPATPLNSDLLMFMCGLLTQAWSLLFYCPIHYCMFTTFTIQYSQLFYLQSGLFN